MEGVSPSILLVGYVHITDAVAPSPAPKRRIISQELPLQKALKGCACLGKRRGIEIVQRTADEL